MLFLWDRNDTPRVREAHLRRVLREAGERRAIGQKTSDTKGRGEEGPTPEEAMRLIPGGPSRHWPTCPAFNADCRRYAADPCVRVDTQIFRAA